MLPLCLMLIDTPDDQQKFEQLYLRYKGLMFFVAYELLQHEQDAEDVVSQTFVRMASKFEQLKIENIYSNRTKNLVVLITRQQAKNMLKQRNRQKNMEISLEIFSDSYDEMEGVDRAKEPYIGDDHIFEKMDMEGLIQVMKALPDRYVDVLYLFYVEDKRIKDIADELGISEGTIRKRMERGRNLLKERLTEFYG